MTLDLFTRNLVALVLQATAVGAIGALLPVVLRMRAPRPLLYYWHALLGVILVLPTLQAVAPVAKRGAASLPLLRFTASAGPGAAVWPAARTVAIVVVGIGAMRLLWLGFGILALHRYWRRAERLAGGGSVGVGVSREIAGPISFGIQQQVILLPEAWRLMSSEVQAAVLCHESRHIARHDWAVHLVEEAIRSVLWFQPAVWYIVGQIRMVREQVVDLEAIQQTRSQDTYIQALLAAVDGGSIFGLPAPCFVRKHQLVKRIRTIKKEYRMSKRRIVVSFAGIALVLFVAGSVAVTSFPLQGAQSGSSGKIYKVGNGVTPPKVLDKVEPEYSAEAKDAHIEGTVLLKVEIAPEGTAQNIEVVQGVGSGLNEKAVEAVKQWKFVPGMKDGEPVTVQAMIEVNFKLK